MTACRQASPVVSEHQQLLGVNACVQRCAGQCIHNGTHVGLASETTHAVNAAVNDVCTSLSSSNLGGDSSTWGASTASAA
jgi:hypothetical protein